MSDLEPVIACRGLSKQLGARFALRNIELSVSGGESVALMGDNGAGKTTLLRCLAALCRPSAGVVLWYGRPAGVQPQDRRKVAMLMCQSCLYEHLTPRENLLFAARMTGTPTRRVDELLERADIEWSTNCTVSQLSTGMRQRLGIARAIIHDPPIWLFDEPGSGLDASGKQWLDDLIAEHRAAGRTICFSTHCAETAKRNSDRILCLDRGTLSCLQHAPFAVGSDVSVRRAA